MKRRRLVLSLLGLAAVPLLLLAQRRGGFGGVTVDDLPPNPAYDGRFTYARIKYGLGGGEFRFRGYPPWLHDFPDADRHFPKIVQELTSLAVRPDESVILSADDPELMKFPFAYICEAGFWLPSDAEVAGMRNYLLKGGFLLFDDFDGNHWYNFETQIKRVLPEAIIIPLTAAHPIFDSFYRITTLEKFVDITNGGTQGEFFGIFEDNDPTKRMMAIVNYNYDVSEFWEFSDQGFVSIDLTNEAYKLGVNYLIYAFSH
jgi:hypothetical protein